MWAFQIIETISMAKQIRSIPNKVLLLLLEKWTVDFVFHRTIKFQKHPAYWHKAPLYFVKQRYLKEKKAQLTPFYHYTI